MSELVQLLNELARNDQLAETYSRDPDSVLSNYELSDAEVKALKSGDLDQVRKASGLSDVHITNSTIKSY